jgi:hypothetical protein
MHAAAAAVVLQVQFVAAAAAAAAVAAVHAVGMPLMQADTTVDNHCHPQSCLVHA